MPEEKQLPTDILELLDTYHIEYKMVGSVAMVHCLFHAGDNTPSMAVYPETNSWFCFGCNQSGTTETLIMKLENCSYQEAVKLLYGNGYEWRRLKNDRSKADKVDEVYLYNIISRNIRKELRHNVGNKDRCDRLKQLIIKYASTPIKPKELFGALKEIKQGGN